MFNEHQINFCLSFVPFLCCFVRFFFSFFYSSSKRKPNKLTISRHIMCDLKFAWHFISFLSRIRFVVLYFAIRNVSSTFKFMLFILCFVFFWFLFFFLVFSCIFQRIGALHRISCNSILSSVKMWATGVWEKKIERKRSRYRNKIVNYILHFSKIKVLDACCLQ